ncbi:hypothetical protein CEN39_21135, partial [Fischerella thermalis CCMEE 5201]
QPTRQYKYSSEHDITGVAILPASLFAGILWQKVGYQATFMLGSVLAIAAILVLVLSFRCNHKFL